MPIHVLIADDEPLARQGLRRLLRAEPDAEVVAECANGAEAMESIRALGPDLAILDIQMPGVDGLAAADALRDVAVPPILVFVTAFDEYAVRAFRVHAFDYLLKPVEGEQFRATMERVRHQLQERNSAAVGRRLATVLEQLGAASGGATAPLPHPDLAAPARYLERIPVRDGERVLFVRASDVDWVEAEGNYVRLHVRKATHQLRETLTRMEHQLDPSQFVRIHRQTLVNVDRIRELQPWFTGDFLLLLHDGTELRLSRTYRAQLDAALYRRRPT